MTQSTDIGPDNSNSAPAADKAPCSQGGRKVYVPPVLTIFGSVSALTQSGSQPAPESPFPATRTRKKASDIRVKENILSIGHHPLGIGLYLFDYKAEFQAEYGYGRQFGVMAQEVEVVLPSAVTKTASGYRQVDYGMLGISDTRR